MRWKRAKDAALKHGLGRTYGPVGAATTDCVRLLYDVLTEAFPTRAFEPGAMMINRGLDKPWSNIEELVDAGFNEAVFPQDGNWYYCQGWRRLDEGRIVAGSSGHAWLYCGGSTGEIIEATNATHRWYRVISWEEQIDKFDRVRLVCMGRR